MSGTDWRIGVRGAVRIVLVIGIAISCGDREVAAEEGRSVQYNRDVLPILAENCFQCHGFDKGTREADLRLDLRPGAIAEREGGPAILPGKPVESTVWERVTSDDETLVMPPPKTGRKLTEKQREILRRWIEEGAEYEQHWAYVVPQKCEPPVVKGAHLEIDRFIRGRLAEEEIAPALEADRATLLRRVTLDLTGLPPTPLEVDAFLHDSRLDAYERVVDRLLTSRLFGERWGRWWLDLAHYADSDGYLQDFIRPTAWRYRDWVVEAFNRDMPFDQFTIEQLAGDLLPNATIPQKIATGFLRNTLSNREGGADLEEYRVRQVVDRTTTVGTTWLALTTGCAECHDHKFDAITQRDFYQLYAYFNNADEVNVDAPLPGETEQRAREQGDYDRKRRELLEPLAGPVAELQEEWEKKLLFTEKNPGLSYGWDRQLEILGLIWGQGEGEGQLEGLNIIKTPKEDRTVAQQQRLTDYFLRNGEMIHPEKFKELKLAEISGKLDELSKMLPPVSRAPAMMRAVWKRKTRIHERGDFRRPGEEVPAGIPQIFAGEGNEQVGDRLSLAKWLVSPEHPLTARVTVNRLWQELFGRGLVGTSENFGVRGERPSHPELLDWLAVDFREQGWSVKKILKKIVLSETYRQSSSARPELAERDPLNRLVARQIRMRMSGEGVRDIALAASGLLNPTVGGPSVKPPQPASVTMEGFDNKWEASPGADRYRRGLYTFIQRTSPFAQLVTFDLPESSRSCTRRERSNTPLQALTLLNDPVFVEMAQGLASRMISEGRDDRERVLRGYLLTLARVPKPPEVERMLGYLDQQRELFRQDPTKAVEFLNGQGVGSDPVEQGAWGAVASVLLNLDEFIVRE